MSARQVKGSETCTDFVNVVVNVLASNDWGDGVGLFLVHSAVALELSRFLFEAGFDSLGIAMLMVTLLDGDDVVMMFLGKDFTVKDGLNGGVVMVLMDFTVDGGRGLFVTLLDDVLVHDGGSNLLVDGGVMVTSLVPVKESCQWQLIDAVFRSV